VKPGKRKENFGDELYGWQRKKTHPQNKDLRLPPIWGFRTSRLAFGSLTISRWCETHSFASLLRNRFAFIVAIVKLKRTRYDRPHLL